ncbi:hypothetical protein QAD02_009411 [Eretmocerus hayati]|uniref:Uncharacterized protein n=1 Tax=Eretmocerus hayati TaxID=131215 RepID=A0ACC2N9E2_9HYME|nr:hypothetical protein QAD02_009411 [Eretmocerus hayati]
MLTHTDIKPYSCSMCDASFRSWGSLNRHRLSHLEDPPFTCTLCYKTFRGELSLEAHMRMHDDQEPVSSQFHSRSANDRIEFTRAECAKKKKFTCGHCDRMFRYRSGLDIHMRLHSSEEPLVCDRCGESYQCRKNYEKHLADHDADENYSFSCEFCTESFDRASGLLNHLDVHIKEGLPSSSGSCDRFGVASTSRDHENQGSLETGRRNFDISE